MVLYSLTQEWTSVERCICDMGQRRLRFICVYLHVPPHLEIVEDLSTETFLLAFCKFTARRSLPTVMVSDNASTYCISLLQMSLLQMRYIP